MNRFKEKILLSIKRIKNKLFPDNSVLKIPTDIKKVDEAASLIIEKINSGKPLMIARYGSTELATIINYLGVHVEEKNIMKYLFGNGLQWWWRKSLIDQMYNWSGFYPANEENVEKFCRLMIEDSKEVDVLGCWTWGEKKMLPYLQNAEFVHLRNLEPFWSKIPWTKVLKNKKVLVVHPFKDTIIRQYNNRENLFENKDILPDFKSLEVIKSVQSLGKEDERFKDWFEALEWMKFEINKKDYDVCLIGCGAYGFPLAAHVKRMGKQAIHLGGALQLMFGIIGKRWEDPMYGVKQWGIKEGDYSNLINDYWVRPDESDTIQAADKVEGACYW